MRPERKSPEGLADDAESVPGLRDKTLAAATHSWQEGAPAVNWSQATGCLVSKRRREVRADAFSDSVSRKLGIAAPAL
eukprot:654344-Pyramimonas_sp.AAC.1